MVLEKCSLLARSQRRHQWMGIISLSHTCPHTALIDVSHARLPHRLRKACSFHMRDPCKCSSKRLHGRSADTVKLNSLSKAIYVSEQVCIGWSRTFVYYTAKLTFFNDFPVKVWVRKCKCAYYVGIFLWYSCPKRYFLVQKHVI